jgi:ATP-dependent helicase/nuclease subunit A
MSGVQGEIPDAEARARALDPQCSFIVKAPAGSGKTSLLVTRFLTLLGGVNRPEEVLAITFTRKATAQMRARVLDALAAARRPAPAAQDAHQQGLHELAVVVAQRDAELDWQLSSNPQRLRIQTIDALCGSLARRLPVMSGLGGGLRTLEDATPLFDSAARRTLALISDKDIGAAVARVLEHVDGNMASFENLVAQMLQRREQWIRYLGLDDQSARRDLQSGMRALVDAGIAAVDQRLPQSERDELLALAQFAAQRARTLDIEPELLALLDVEQFPHARSETLAQWKSLAQLLLTKDGGIRKTVLRKIFVKSATPDEYAAMSGLLKTLAENERLAPALAALRALPAPRYDEQQWRTLQDLFLVLKIALAMLRLEFAQASASDFTEQVLAASQALGDEQAPTDVTLALDHRIRHLLIDEFQDTSVAHFEILNKLIAGWTQFDGHSLFVVGDPMQSIYRFREAEVGLFLSCYRDGLQSIDLQALTLSANFRSRAGVVDWVNQSFAHILPERDEPVLAAVAFEHSQALRGPGVRPAVQVHAARDEDLESQALRVALCVAAVRAEHPQSSVAILVRARSHAHPIVDALNAHKLTWRGVDLQPLFSVPAVRDLHALTCAVLHPLDRASWLAVLRAPWCGLTLDDLDLLAGDAPSKTLSYLLSDESVLRRLSADGRARLARVTPVLRELVEQSGEDRLAASIRRGWRALGGPACLDGASIEDPRRYLELLAQTERETGLPDPDELARRVAQLYAAPRADDVDVEIMTIHRAKGLEFDIVLLPALERVPRADSATMLAWSRIAVDSGNGLLLAPLPPPEGEEHSPIHRFVRGVERDKRRLETARLLYVACTRAKEQMHLFASVRWSRSKDELTLPGADSLLSHLWPAVAQHFKELPTPVLEESIADDAQHREEGALAESQQHIWRLPANYRVVGLPPALVGSDWKPAQWSIPGPGAVLAWLEASPTRCYAKSVLMACRVGRHSACSALAHSGTSNFKLWVWKVRTWRRLASWLSKRCRARSAIHEAGGCWEKSTLWRAANMQ